MAPAYNFSGFKKIKVDKPVADLDGDEMTRVWFGNYIILILIIFISIDHLEND